MNRKERREKTNATYPFSGAKEIEVATLSTLEEILDVLEKIDNNLKK